MPPPPPGDAPITPDDPSPGDAWVALSLHLPVADAEMVADVLAAMAPGGAAVDTPFRNIEPERFGLELTDEDATVRAFFPAPLTAAERRAIRRRLATLPLGVPLPRLRYTEVGEADWAEEWKRFYHPFRVGRLLVQPSWEPATDARPDDLVITLDPGRAFGTGQHETTRLCLAALDRFVRPGAAVLDVGTGSGILALAAARLGASRVDALDTDPVAVAATRENATRNGLADRVDVGEGSLGAAWPWHGASRGGYDCVAMNIALVVVTELLPGATAALRPGGVLVASGFLAEAAPDVEEAARAAGLHDVERRVDGEWGAVVAHA